MIILTKDELIEAFQCAFMEYHDLGPKDSNKEIMEKYDNMEALQDRLMEKVMDACLKYPHVEWRLHV